VVHRQCYWWSTAVLLVARSATGGPQCYWWPAVLMVAHSAPGGPQCSWWPTVLLVAHSAPGGPQCSWWPAVLMVAHSASGGPQCHWWLQCYWCWRPADAVFTHYTAVTAVSTHTCSPAALSDKTVHVNTTVHTHFRVTKVADNARTQHSHILLDAWSHRGG